MKPILSFLIICSLFSSCDCKDVDQINISEWSIPDSVKLNDNVKFMFQSEATNGCWGDLHISFKKTKEYNYSAEAIGTKTCCACICPAVMVYQDTLIDFRPTSTGMYLFRIWENPKLSIIDTMIVE